MFLTPCDSNFIYVYKYACLVKLKYLHSIISSKLDLYTAVLQVNSPAVRDSSAPARARGGRNATHISRACLFRAILAPARVGRLYRISCSRPRAPPAVVARAMF